MIISLFYADTKIEDNSRAFKLQKANFDSEVNTAVRRHNEIIEDDLGFIMSTFLESRGSAGVRTSGSQDPAENQTGRITNPG